MDANQGYFQLVLDESSRDDTAFNMAFATYRYKRLPMGITSATELFQQAFADIFGNIDEMEIVMDDFWIVAKDLQKHNIILQKVL